jgi:Uma2 family endonuclease
MATITAPLASAEFELLNGEWIEMPSATGLHNFLVARLIRRLGDWIEDHAGGVMIPDTEFLIGESRLRPDIAVLSPEKWERSGKGVPMPEPPEIAIEIVSPSESAITVEEKIEAYLNAEVQEVWVLYPSTGRMFIHTIKGVRRLDRTSVIETPIAPGWSLSMAELLRS